MVTDAMLKAAAIEAENALISMAPESGETHEFSKRFEKKIQNLTQRVRNPSRYYFKRIAPAVACVLVALIATAAITGFKISKRISFGGGELAGDDFCPVDENTVVINNATDSLPTQLPIYRIRERDFSDEEFSQIQNSLTPRYSSELEWKRDGNKIRGTFGDFYDSTFSMTDEKLEELAWETLRKIPCLGGDYEYVGITGKHTTSSLEKTSINSVRVTFCPLLDGVRVTGNDYCHMWFTNSGLMEISIQRFSYMQLGTMDLIPLAEAEARINTPDDFSMDKLGEHYVQQLNVEEVRVQLVNQHARGCAILQPVYKFTGVATLKSDGAKTQFSSRIIAVPKFYTYG